jgi:hypothetical protein
MIGSNRPLDSPKTQPKEAVTESLNLFVPTIGSARSTGRPEPWLNGRRAGTATGGATLFEVASVVPPSAQPDAFDCDIGDGGNNTSESEFSEHTANCVADRFNFAARCSAK